VNLPPLEIETLHEYDEKTRLRFALPVIAEHYPNTEIDAIVVAACSARKILVEDAVAAAHAVKDSQPSQLQLNGANIMFNRKNVLIKGKAFFGHGLTPAGDKSLSYPSSVPLAHHDDGDPFIVAFWRKYCIRGFWSDFACFVRNHHPVCVLFLSDRNHPYSKR